ncbi:MAG: hypothetical protein O3C40_06575 [Planctomycetota bacterium]|nr:hypothetical protein [Planctomycetota bacterium]
MFQLCAFAGLAAVTGCSTWSTATVTELPLPRMAPDSVLLEAAFVRVPPEQPLDILWHQIDEQHLDAETRRNLNANGIRCGVMGSQLPNELRELMGSAGSDQPATAGESLLTDGVTSLYRKLQNRSGERSDLIVVPAISERQVVVFSEEDRIRAETFDRGQALCAVRSYPSGDGTVRVELVPEIRHGDLKPQWVPGNGTILRDVGRETRAFDQLRVAAVLSPGQTLLVTGTDEARGLGGLLFARGSGESSERLILLLRLAQTQYDDLFAPEQAVEPLATPFD